MSPEALTWHVATVAETLAAEDVKPETGLSEGEVEARRRESGRNVLSEAKKEPKA